MQTLQRAPVWRILRNESEMAEGLAMAGIDPARIGADPSYTFERLVDSCDKHHMFLMQKEQSVKLVVFVSVVILQCHRGLDLFELKEDRQVFHGSGNEIYRKYRGLAETNMRNGEHGLIGHMTKEAHRVLAEELGQTVPLFKEGTGYCFTRGWVEILRQVHDKWPPIQAEFVRFVQLAYLCNEKLYSDEYIEVTPTKKVYSSWHRTKLEDNAKLPVMVPLP